MKITKDRLKKIISEEIENITAEDNLEEEQLEEGLMDDPDCARVARRKYDEYGGSPFEYYDRCMEARKSSGGGSSPSYASTGWARKSSLDHMSDIGRFEEGKVTKTALKHIVNEEMQKMINEGWFDRLRARGAAGVASLKGKTKGALQRGVGKLATAVGAGEAGAALGQKGTETAAAAVAKGTGIKIKTILNTHVKEMENDLAKLGLGEDEDVVDAMTNLRMSLANAVKRAEGAT